ncbi:unnamed protein product, partial [Amoebophrya sp. A25]
FSNHYIRNRLQSSSENAMEKAAGVNTDRLMRIEPRYLNDADSSAFWTGETVYANQRTSKQVVTLGELGEWATLDDAGFDSGQQMQILDRYRWGNSVCTNYNDYADDDEGMRMRCNVGAEVLVKSGRGGYLSLDASVAEGQAATIDIEDQWSGTKPASLR